MTVGERSPIPLKPTLARTMSARRRRQRPTKTPHADQVLGALWKMAEPRQSVWNRVEVEDDSEIEEVEELDSCLMPYDQLQSEQSRSSTGVSSSDRLPSSSSLEDPCSPSDYKKVSYCPDTDAVFSGKPILVRSPTVRRLKQLNKGQKSRPRTDREAPPVNFKRTMGNSESTSRPLDGTTIASFNHSKINVVGKGIFPCTKSQVTRLSHVSPPPPRRVDAWNSASSLTRGLPDVSTNHVGRDVTSKQKTEKNSPTPTYEYEDDFESSASGSENNEQLGISISRITRDKLFKRQQEVTKEVGKRSQTKQRNRQQRLEHKQEGDHQATPKSKEEIGEASIIITRTQSEGSKPDVENECKVKRHNSLKEILSSQKQPEAPKSNNFLSSDTTSPHVVSSSRRASRTRTKVSPERAVSSQSLPGRTTKKVPVVSATISERGSSESSGSFSNPHDALRKALEAITTDDWLQKVHAINDFSRFTKYHPQVLQPELHSVVTALLPEVRNLRSTVSRAAITTLGELFQTFTRHMETDLDVITKTLLNKSAENVGFIREDIDRTLKYLVEDVSTQKAALALVEGGASHRNAAVRRTAAEFLSMTVEKMGPSRCLTGCKETAEKILPATAQFVMDGSPLARYYGRTIFCTLMKHPDFEKLLQKYVSSSTIRNISNILDSIRKKGVGERPKDGISAKPKSFRSHSVKTKPT
ncbi:uncharacterized protein LOC143251873 isoform X2 [Tachypleus tridentatus]